MNNQTYRITLNAAALLPLAPGETGVCQPHQLVSRPLLPARQRPAVRGTEALPAGVLQHKRPPHQGAAWHGPRRADLSLADRS